MSNPKRQRTDDDAPEDPAESKQVLVYRNGNNREWKPFTVPTSLEVLLEKVGASFGIEAKRLFTNTGGEIKSIDDLRNMDVLYASSGEDFKQVQEMTVPSLPRGSTEWVLLNVGGQYFLTTKTTLTSSDPCSMFANLFSEGPNLAGIVVEKDDHGAYVFDRDPVYFKPLLNYLRYKEVVLDKNVSAEGVLKEAEYFGIRSVVKELRTIIQEKKERDRTKAESAGLPEPGIVHPLTRDDVMQAIVRIPVADIRFQAADFTGADLSKLDLSRINFKWAKLEKCDLSYATLNHCCFVGADLHEAKLEKAHLLGVNLREANLSGVSAKLCIFGKHGDSADDIASLEGANLADAVLDGSKMYGVNLKGAQLHNVSLVGCDMRSAVLVDATMVDCKLHGCDMHDVVLG